MVRVGGSTLEIGNRTEIHRFQFYGTGNYTGDLENCLALVNTAQSEQFRFGQFLLLTTPRDAYKSVCAPS